MSHARLSQLQRARVRVAFLVLGALVLTLALLPLLLFKEPWAARAAGWLDGALFGAVCHQLPARSPAFGGVHAGLCWRCLALLVGGLAGTLAAGRGGGGWSRRRGLAVLAVALAPMLADVLLQHLGVYVSNTSRALSGLVAGCGAGLSLLASASPAPPEGVP